MQFRRTLVKKAKAPLQDKVKLLQDVNLKYEDKLVEFAKYFANAKNAQVASIADADCEGLDLSCKNYLE